MEWEGASAGQRLQTKTKRIAIQSSAAIERWGFLARVHRHTACITIYDKNTDKRYYQWHPIRKQFRVAGFDEWFTPGPGNGIVKIMVNLCIRELKDEQKIPGFAEYLERARSS